MKTLTLELPDELHEKLEELAAEINATIEDTIVAIICRYLFTLTEPSTAGNSPEEYEKKLQQSDQRATEVI